MMKKLLSIFVALVFVLSCVSVYADTESTNPPTPPTGTSSGTPPEKPSGDMGSGETPPEKPDGDNGGTPPEMPSGENGGGTPPDGMGGGQAPDGMGGGMQGAPTSYEAVNSYAEDTELSGETIVSTGKDENAVLVTGGNVVLTGCSITRNSTESTGGDNSSFYGVGAAALVTGGTLTVTNTTIATDAAGGAGVFAYGDGIAYVSDSTITTTQNTSGGIHVAGGGTLYANNLTVVTEGESSAAIRSDRGGGKMIVSGGNYTSNGLGSPAVYVTADISVANAELTATGSEAICLEGKNSLTLTDCNLEGNMLDQEQNDNTWTVILYQSMSGDSEVGKGSFTMTGGKLTSLNGGLFYTTNTDSEFTLNNVELVPSEGFEYLLRCTGNSNQRGWGSSGANGANCVFTAIQQEMEGTILWDSISTLDLSLTEGTVYTGAILQDESCAGNGGSGTCAVVIDESSTWIVTGDSLVTSLTNAGKLVDADGNTVTVKLASGEVLSEGTGAYSVTVESYIAE